MCKDFREALGKNIRKIRREKKLTQEFVSMEAGLSRSHIAMIESGKRDVTMSALFKISRALKISMAEIFAFDDIAKYKFNSDDLYV